MAVKLVIREQDNKQSVNLCSYTCSGEHFVASCHAELSGKYMYSRLLPFSSHTDELSHATSGTHRGGVSVEIEEGGEEQQECMQENGMFLVSGYEKLSFCSESPKFNAHQNSQSHHYHRQMSFSSSSLTVSRSPF